MVRPFTRVSESLAASLESSCIFLLFALFYSLLQDSHLSDGPYYSVPSPPNSGDPTDTDYTAVGCAITTISSNLTEMSKGVKLLAALMDDEVGSGHKLMGAARMLAGAVSDLLRSVEPAAAEVSSPLIIVLTWTSSSR